MWSRNRWCVMVVALLPALTIACGSSDRESAAAEAVGAVAVPDRAEPTADPTIAGHALSAFGLDLFGVVRAGADGENVTLSPASIAIALAMVEPGANDAAQTQFRELLRIGEPAEFHASMNALEQSLESRMPEPPNEGDDPGELDLRVANAAYLQRDYPFLPAYLQAIGTAYGPTLHQVDFSADPDAVAHQINDAVAEATNDRIDELIGDGVIKPETVLALVNALYVKVSWLEPFDAAATADEPFTLLDGTDITVPLMHGTSASSARGDSWIGASKPYVGGLTAQFILPDEGRFDEVADNLDAVFAEFDTNRTSGASLAMPRFETRFGIELPAALQALGLTAPFVQGGLVGIADDPRLVIDTVIHEAFVAMDEEGTEAAAATVVLMYPTSAPAVEPVPVVLDRPFIYRIIDDETGATLFVGQVVNPGATG